MAMRNFFFDLRKNRCDITDTVALTRCQVLFAIDKMIVKKL
jgi:hypothetical protein